MSGVPVSRRLWITPLSPVHMGTDEDYAPTGYVIEGDALYEFDYQALQNLPQSERAAFDKLLSGKATADMLTHIQAFFHKNRDWLIPAAVNVVYVSDGLASLYKARVGQAANIESRGGKVQNKLEIERAAYNPIDRRLFLPGSGLKGAIRTALLDSLNQGKRSKHKENNRDLQKRLFGGAFDTDPMRLLHIGDCSWQGAEDLNSAEILFAVNRKKQPVEKNGVLLQSQAEQKGLYQMLECATPFRAHAFQGLLDIPDLSGIKGKQDQLPRRQFSFSDVASACNRFYRPVFDAEIALLKKRGFLDTDWQKTVMSLLDDSGIRQRLDNNEAFLLRAGRHSGAESVTLNGVRSIKIMQGSGGRASWESAAKTIWLSTGDQQDKRYLRPFGWLLVEMTALIESPPEWTEAQEVIDRHASKMLGWLKAVNEHRAELAVVVESNREKAARRAEEKEKEAAEEARHKEVEEKRMAAMSPLEREIEEVCKQGQGSNPAATLFNKLEAGDWTGEADKLIVANKIKSLWESEKTWNPGFAGTNKKKKQQCERCRKVLVYLGDN